MTAASAPPPMVPNSEDRFDACLDNGGNCDQFLGIAAIDKAYRDGWNAAQSALAERDAEIARLKSACDEKQQWLVKLTDQWREASAERDRALSQRDAARDLAARVSGAARVEGVRGEPQ